MWHLGTKSTLEERIIREVLLLCGMGVLALIQVTMLHGPLGFPPALLLVLVVCRVLVGIRSNQPERGTIIALRWAFYGGLFLDVLSTTPLGSHALALLAATMLVFVLSAKLHVEGPLLPLISVFLGGGVYESILALIYTSTVAVFQWQAYALVIMLPSVLLALIPTLPTFFIMRWLLGDDTRATDDARERVRL